MMKKRITSLLLVAVMVLTMVPAATAETEQYTKLTDDTELSLNDECVYIDLAGNDLTVSGSGKVYAIDSANDTYDAAACGKIIATDTVTVEADVTEPNGKRYIAVSENGETTMHRLDMGLTDVVLRPRSAGIYYKAVYNCDDVLSSKVKAYGVVLSLYNMPGADFKTEPELLNSNRYTVAAEPFKSGAAVTSGAVFGILKEENNNAQNASNGQKKIYANAYVDFGSGPLVADTKNPGKTATMPGFTGVAFSLKDVMGRLDKSYSALPYETCLQIDNFYNTWKDKGMNWEVENIGEALANQFDNSSISDKFDPGTTNAVCPVCQEKVTWTALTNTAVVNVSGGHYYLADDLTFTGTSTAAFISNGTKNTTGCVHLNGYNLTATKTRAFFGSSGKLNVMGEGVVKGYNNKEGAGSTVQLNNSVAGNGIYLYGGTYEKAPGVPDTLAVLNVLGNSGVLYLFRGVTVNNPDGMAVKVFQPKAKSTELSIQGSTINGDVVILGANASSKYTSTVLVDGATVSGTMDLGENTKAILSGATKITALTRQEEVLLNVAGLKKGASIGMSTDGVFTSQLENAKNYIPYFHSAKVSGKVTVIEGALYCGVFYTDGVEFIGDTKNAVCSVCDKIVTWTVLDGATTCVEGGHYYLTANAEVTGEGAFLSAPAAGQACVNLNGYNITATCAVSAVGGTLNLLGTGKVSGAVEANGGKINLYSGTYKDITAENAGEIALHKDTSCENITLGNNAVANLSEITVSGNITTTATGATVNGINVTVGGQVNITEGNLAAFSEKTVLGQLNVAPGVLVDFDDLLPGSSVKVSAEGVFTTELTSARNALKYFSTDDQGDWIVTRDNFLYQGERVALESAGETDITALNTAYDGKTVKYGELHDHTKTGPNGDGRQTLSHWKATMDKLNIDFATIVDHKQSYHMYDSQWDKAYFVGGTEPSSTLKEMSAFSTKAHYNMIFPNVEAMETLIQKYADYYQPVAYEQGGITFTYPQFTATQFSQIAKDVYDLGGFFVLVHPKYDGYIVSDNSMDYYFGDYTGFEISTGSGGNMCYKDNEEAYQTWLDMLDNGKIVFATAGSDKHNVANTSGLTTMYTRQDIDTDYVATIRSGNMAPGWVGIRMAMGNASMGGMTEFAGQRLSFSVGDIYTADSANPVYVAGHIYRAELYDDSGLLMEAVIDPTETSYFAVDAAEDAKFYRVVVWDDTAATRVGVSNPIWNSTFYN